MSSVPGRMHELDGHPFLRQRRSFAALTSSPAGGVESKMPLVPGQMREVATSSPAGTESITLLPPGLMPTQRGVLLPGPASSTSSPAAVTIESQMPLFDPNVPAMTTVWFGDPPPNVTPDAYTSSSVSGVSQIPLGPV